MPISSIFGGCCFGESPASQKVSCVNTLVLLVALAAIGAAVIGALGVAANLPHGVAGLGAISSLGLPGGVTLTVLGLVGFIAFALLLVKRCCSPNSPSSLTKSTQPRPTPQEHVEFFEQELKNTKVNTSTLVKAPLQPTYTQVEPGAGKKLEELPDEMLLEILGHLDEKSLILFGRTNKRHFSLVKSEFPGCVLKGLLRLEALNAWKKGQTINWHEKNHLQRAERFLTVELLAPFCAKKILEETGRILKGIETAENKFQALEFVAYALYGMYRVDSQEVIVQVQQVFKITFQLKKDKKISAIEAESIVGRVSKPLVRDMTLSKKYEKQLFNDFPKLFSNDTFVSDKIEALADLNIDEMFSCLEKINSALTKRELLSKIINICVENKDTTRIKKIISYISSHQLEREIGLLELAGAYALIGQFDKARSLPLRDPLAIGDLAVSIAKQLDISDSFRQNFSSFVDWVDALLETEKAQEYPYVRRTLLKALAIILQKRSKSKIKDIELAKINNLFAKMDKESYGLALRWISIGLCEIGEINKAQTQAAKISSHPLHKIPSYVHLAEVLLIKDKSNRARAQGLLESALKDYTTFITAPIHQNKMAPVLFQMAQLFAKIDLKKAQEAFESARQIVEKAGSYFPENCRLPALKALISIQNAKGSFNNAQESIQFIKDKIDPDATGFLLARLADDLTLNFRQNLWSLLLLEE